MATNMTFGFQVEEPEVRLTFGQMGNIGMETVQSLVEQFDGLIRSVFWEYPSPPYPLGVAVIALENDNDADAFIRRVSRRITKLGARRDDFTGVECFD